MTDSARWAITLAGMDNAGADRWLREIVAETEGALVSAIAKRMPAGVRVRVDGGGINVVPAWGEEGARADG